MSEKINPSEPGRLVQADTGLGTSYERWALNRALVELSAAWQIESVFEGPGDGMTGIFGINSLVLGRKGLSVTLLPQENEKIDFLKEVWRMHAPQASLKVVEAWDGKRLPFGDRSFDLAWNFNVLTRWADPFELLSEMCRISRRAVFLCVPNRSNYSFWLHRLHHRVAKKTWDHGPVNLMVPRPWEQALSGCGLKVQKVFYLDCPWWPDIVNPAELIADFFPFLRRFAGQASPENRMSWPADRLPYYQPEHSQEFFTRMNRLAFLEDSPLRPVNRLFGHHLAIFAVKDGLPQ